jgi:hypothetical protein
LRILSECGLLGADSRELVSSAFVLNVPDQKLGCGLQLAVGSRLAVAQAVTARYQEDIPGVKQPEALFLSRAKQLLLHSLNSSD